MVRNKIFRVYEIWAKHEIPFKDSGLYGNEVNVFGYKFHVKMRRELRRVGNPRWWQPFNDRISLYSESLDRKFNIFVTRNVERKIDELGGLDNYLLQMSDEEINSKVGIEIKRMIQTKLNLPLSPPLPDPKDISFEEKNRLFEYGHYDPTSLVLQERRTESSDYRPPITVHRHLKRERQREENLLKDEQYKYGVSPGQKEVGYLNLPRDRRFTVFQDDNVPDRPYFLTREWIMQTIGDGHYRPPFANSWQIAKYTSTQLKTSTYGFLCNFIY